MLVEDCVAQLCEPSLSQSAEEEKQETARAKTTVHLLRVLAELTPTQFTGHGIFESLISLLRHEDDDIGGCGNGCGMNWAWPGLFVTCSFGFSSAIF